jgi:hypothetical protein
MIDPLPKEQDISAFFEVAPTLSDPDVPWCYNAITFQFESGENRIEVEISPSYESFTLRWWQENRVAVSLALNGVTSLSIVHEGRFLEARGRERVLRLQLRPDINVDYRVEAGG